MQLPLPGFGRLRFAASFAATAMCCAVAAAPTAADQSLQGYSGLIEIPNAGVTPEGQLDLHYNNDIESSITRQADGADNYIFSIGAWKRLELGGRIAITDRNGSRNRTDLSGQVKLNLFSSKHLSAAAGVADFAGEARNLRARYGVLTGHLPYGIDVTAGFGGGPDRLDGVFGGIEIPVLRYFRLMAEHDTEEVNYGLRAKYALRNGLFAAATVSGSSGRNQNVSFGITIGIPLTASRTVSSPSRLKEPPQREQTEAGVIDPAPPEETGLAGLPGAVRAGRIRAFASTDTPTNSLLSWQDVGVLDEDGLLTIAPVRNVEYRYGVPVREVDAFGNIRWSSQRRRLGFPLEAPIRGELRIDPNLRQVVATETGVYEFSLALDTSARAQLPLGIGGYATYTAAAARSNQFGNNGIFRSRRHRSGLSESAVQWTLHPLGGWFTNLSYGRTEVEEQDYNFFHAETALLSPRGNHRLRFAYGDYDPFDSLNFPDRNIRIAEYRYFWIEKELAVQISYGRHFFDDDGGKISLTRFFGDVSFQLFYQRDEDDIQVGGVAISIPLTAKRPPRIGPVLITGSPGWRNSVGTTLRTDSGRNEIRPLSLREPRPVFNLIDDVLDRDRALPAYLQ